VHVPALSATSQASHSPVQALLQQTPSTQNPLAQAAFEPHACPSACVPWQWPIAQKASGAHSLAIVHADGHVTEVPVQT
jgi:hypothetical protein